MKTVIRFMGLVGIMAGYSLMLWTFMTAYSRESKSVLVQIDWYGEALVELIISLILLPCAVYFAWWSINKMAEESVTVSHK